jgi:phosphoenolpyruvate-protein kinase (PTS system EI component)
VQAFRGIGPYAGYAIGPAFLFRDRDSLPAARALNVPHVIVAPYLDDRLIGMLDLRRVYGLVLEHGSVCDPVFDALETIPKPSVVGARRVFEYARPGATVVVDGAEGRVVLDPAPEILAHYEALRGTRPPREDPTIREVLKRLALQIRHARMVRGSPLPFDMPSQRRLLELCRRITEGALPTAEEEAYVKSLLERDDVP